MSTPGARDGNSRAMKEWLGIAAAKTLHLDWNIQPELSEAAARFINDADYTVEDLFDLGE